jgi:hypothetical protein
MSPLTVETILKKAGEHLELGGLPGKLEHEDTGKESSFPEDLVVKDLEIKKDFVYLADFLAVLAPPEEIIRIYNEHPDKVRAKRKHGGSCTGCDKDDGGGCSEKKGKKA